MELLGFFFVFLLIIWEFHPKLNSFPVLPAPLHQLLCPPFPWQKNSPSRLCISHMLIGSCLFLTGMFSPVSCISIPKQFLLSYLSVWATLTCPFFGIPKCPANTPITEVSIVYWSYQLLSLILFLTTKNIRRCQLKLKLKSHWILDTYCFKNIQPLE